jgi:hypothetical protein
MSTRQQDQGAHDKDPLDALQLNKLACELEDKMWKEYMHRF